jgi:hypothetical protein
MKELDEKFKQAVAALRKKKNGFTLVVGTVKAIEGDTCTVANFEDVRLNAVIDSLETQFTIYPKIGSKVIIGSLENSSDMAVLKFSEIDKVTVKIGDQLFEMKENKFTIKSGEVDLKSILNDAFDRLDKAIITTPSGPGKFSPADKLIFKDLKTKTNQLLS